MRLLSRISGCEDRLPGVFRVQRRIDSASEISCLWEGEASAELLHHELQVNEEQILAESQFVPNGFR